MTTEKKLRKYSEDISICMNDCGNKHCFRNHKYIDLRGCVFTASYFKDDPYVCEGWIKEKEE